MESTRPPSLGAMGGLFRRIKMFWVLFTAACMFWMFACIRVLLGGPVMPARES